MPRLREFTGHLPANRRAAFEFRDPSWHEPAVLEALEEAGCALVVSVSGARPAPREAPMPGPFGYIGFHRGAHGIGLSEDELRGWAERIQAEAGAGREIFVYFNNDPHGYAITNARRLRELLLSALVATGD